MNLVSALISKYIWLFYYIALKVTVNKIKQEKSQKNFNYFSSSCWPLGFLLLHKMLLHLIVHCTLMDSVACNARTLSGGWYKPFNKGTNKKCIYFSLNKILLCETHFFFHFHQVTINSFICLSVFPNNSTGANRFYHLLSD